MSWTLTDATTWLQREYGPAEDQGWLLTIVGSVMRDGHGQDLDVRALQEQPRSAALWERWDERWPVLHRENYQGQVIRTYQFGSRLIDVWFVPYVKSWACEICPIKQARAWDG
jgi:hypothetical protein